MTTRPPDGGRPLVTPDDVREILVADTGVAREALHGQDRTPLQDLGLDSLAMLQLQSRIERRYGVEIPEDALLMSLADLVAFVAGRAGPVGAEGGS